VSLLQRDATHVDVFAVVDNDKRTVLSTFGWVKQTHRCTFIKNYPTCTISVAPSGSSPSIMVAATMTNRPTNMDLSGRWGLSSTTFCFRSITSSKQNQLCLWLMQTLAASGVRTQSCPLSLLVNAARSRAVCSQYDFCRKGFVIL
jgi:hypothetical protein